MKLKILFIYSNESDPCTQLHCFELAKGLERYAGTSIVHFKDLVESILLDYHVVIFQRIGATGTEVAKKDFDFISFLIKKYRTTKVFIYFLDDLVVEDQGGMPKEFMRMCHAVICTTERLKKNLSSFNERIYVLRNYVDLDFVKAVKKRKLKGFNAIWISTAGLGADMMKQIINQVNKDMPISFFYFGGMHKSLADIEGIFSYPFQPFRDMISWLKGCDILLNPMSPDQEYKTMLENRTKRNIEEFLQCKSEIKYILAGATKTAFISSITESNLYAVTSNWNGLLLEDTVTDWVDAIKRLYHDAELRKTMIKNAYADVMDRYTLKDAARNAMEIFTGLLGCHLENHSLN